MRWGSTDAFTQGCTAIEDCRDDDALDGPLKDSDINLKTTPMDDEITIEDVFGSKKFFFLN